jgi:hypothetical protein
MAQIQSSRNGHDYLTIKTGYNEITVRVDEFNKRFIKGNAKFIDYDAASNQVVYHMHRGSSAGRKTTLAKRLYSVCKAHKTIDEVQKHVRFKNGKNNDFRLQNLTTRN